MFGISYIRFDSMTYVIQYKNGEVVREGRGLAFFYNTLNTSIVAIPIGSNDLPFIFNETTQDYQNVSIQGQVNYKIADSKQLSEIFDFTVDGNGIYKKNELEKLNQRIINEAQTATSSYVRGLGLKDAIRSAKMVEEKITEGLSVSKGISILGIEILSVSILAIKATPEMARSLETETREKLYQDADQAIYARRNFAVEQERKIKESELNTEIAVEEKKKQIDEKKMQSQVQQAENDRKLREMKLQADITIENQRAENDRKLREMKIQADIAVENQRKTLIEQKTLNERKEAETRGFVIETTLKPYKELDWKLLTALNNNPDPKFNISLAFRELAENAGKIGNLNISPELLESLVKETPKK